MMNKKINTDARSLKFIFNRNKSYIFSALAVLACIILFFQFIIPQFRTLLAAKKEAAEISQKLETLSNNLNILANINENSLDSQLKILYSALPSSKDFVGILNSLNYASVKAGVNFDTFSVQIGNLSNPEGNKKISTIDMSLPINANVTAVGNFMETISNSFPLADVTLLKIGDGRSSINISFYYKPTGVFENDDNRINPISQEELALISKLSAFENPTLSSGSAD